MEILEAIETADQLTLRALSKALIAQRDCMIASNPNFASNDEMMEKMKQSLDNQLVSILDGI